MIDRTCCFVGHRKIENVNNIKQKLYEIIEELIKNKNIDIFLFGSKSQFDTICHEVVSDMKSKYPNIKRVFVRAEFPYIDENYKNYILGDYEDTYYPEHMINAGKASYVERNYEMINKSSVCIFYYNPDYNPPRRKKGENSLTDYQPKSGTKIAYECAEKKGKIIINIKNDI